MPAITLAYPAVSPYLAADELRNFYAQAEIDQLADRNSDNVADTGAQGPVGDVVDTAIARAAAELDSFLAQCFVLPLAPAPGFAALPSHLPMLLAEWVGVIARYRLWDDWRGQNNPEQVPEPRRRYQDLIKKLSATDTCGACACKFLGAGVLTLAQAGLSPTSMPLLASDGSHWRRPDWDFGAQGAYDGQRSLLNHNDHNRHSGRAWNGLQ